MRRVIDPVVAFERARRGGEATLSRYGREHFSRISKGRKPIPRFIPKKGSAGVRPGTRPGLNEEARITEVEEMRRPGLAVECGPGSRGHLSEETQGMVAEIASPPDVGPYHFYRTPRLGDAEWRVYRGNRALGTVEQLRDGFAGLRPGRVLVRGGFRSRMDAARWLGACAASEV